MRSVQDRVLNAIEGAANRGGREAVQASQYGNRGRIHILTKESVPVRLLRIDYDFQHDNVKLTAYVGDSGTEALNVWGEMGSEAFRLSWLDLLNGVAGKTPLDVIGGGE